MGLYNKLSELIISASKYIQHKDTDKKIDNVLKIATFNRIVQKRPKNFENIVFVTPYMNKHSGGLTSVLRIAKRLEDKGIDVYFTCPLSENCKQMTENAKLNLSCFIANYITWDSAKERNFDFVIPVQDTIVYYARLLKGYLVYFVQDYEPYFNPIGDRYFLSKKAYELGEDIISLGSWNLKEIKKNLNINNIGDMYSIEFPFESSEYPYIKRDFKVYNQKKEINIAVYIKRESKRLPGIVMNMLERTYLDYRKKGIQLNIYYFGLHKIEKPKVGINLGRITKNEIKELYAKCDFGLVASMTNISLVPYEMIGSGLPVIEFKDGSYTSFLGEDTAILLENFDYQELSGKLQYYMDHNQELELMCVRARNKIKNLSWNKTGKEFYDILKVITYQG